ncbi:hypothetical protein H6G76_14920 [Nostoc sp. FACHB-152]|uniref:hypothetical protein n=1 Tax=unclassified Nostoc TaxID=2593658 RepID=UPI0016862721|nr:MULTISPECIES: hypothetical protein [unclassified Nostoc]MBD2448427.1 hypothetical protein [Nostoc sp. FACHB-152]MBD2470867.1 hypothetical protein [Nostoc sp. FACHB-145]
MSRKIKGLGKDVGVQGRTKVLSPLPLCSTQQNRIGAIATWLGRRSLRQMGAK